MLAQLYGKTEDDEQRFKLLDRVYELGCRFWDTAEHVTRRRAVGSAIDGIH